MNRRIPALVALAVGLAVGLFLVFTGGDDEGSTPSSPTTSSVVDGADPDAGGTDGPSDDLSPLPLEDTSQAAIEELTGLDLPEGTAEFLTARLDDDRQLDITFVLPADAVEEFVAASQLPELEADRRVVIHSSPLWRLNPDEGTSLVGGSDRFGDVRRSVELLTSPEGTVRARVVVIAAG